MRAARRLWSRSLGKGEVITAHDLVESGAAWVTAYDDGMLLRTGEELTSI